MDVGRVPEDLRNRLGLEATVGLVEMFNEAEAEWRTGVTEQLVDRFERRLVEETSTLRIQMAEGFAALRQEIGNVRDDLRQEIAAGPQETGRVRLELRQEIGSVRQEIAGLRADIATGRFELLKWTFIFWVGQVFAIGSIVALLLRVVRPAV